MQQSHPFSSMELWVETFIIIPAHLFINTRHLCTSACMRISWYIKNTFTAIFSPLIQHPSPLDKLKQCIIRTKIQEQHPNAFAGGWVKRANNPSFGLRFKIFFQNKLLYTLFRFIYGMILLRNFHISLFIGCIGEYFKRVLLMVWGSVTFPTGLHPSLCPTSSEDCQHPNARSLSPGISVEPRVLIVDVMAMKRRFLVPFQVLIMILEDSFPCGTVIVHSV